MVDPKNLNPLFFMSLLIASDSGEVGGISLKKWYVFIFGCLFGKKDKT